MEPFSPVEPPGYQRGSDNKGSNEKADEARTGADVHVTTQFLAEASRRRGLARVLHVLARLPGGRAFLRLHTRVLRTTAGRSLGQWFGAPLLLLEVRGRRTGITRRVSIVGVPFADGWVVTSANAGLDRLPAWPRNLEHAGTAVVVHRGVRYRVRARKPAAAEAPGLWSEYLRHAPAVAHFQAMTARPFELLVLERTSTDG